MICLLFDAHAGIVDVTTHPRVLLLLPVRATNPQVTRALLARELEKEIWIAAAIRTYFFDFFFQFLYFKSKFAYGTLLTTF